MISRLLWALASSLAFVLPVLFPAWLGGVVAHADEVIVLGMLGAAVGSFVPDLRLGVQVAVSRLAIAMSLLFLALVAVLLADPGRAEVGFGLLLLIGPGLSALGSGLYTPGRFNWILEVLACAGGMVAWAWLAVRGLLVASWAMVGPAWLVDRSPSWEWFLSGGSESAGLVALITLPMIGFVAVRLRGWRGGRAAIVFAVLAAGWALLSWSFRFPALIALLWFAAYVLLRWPVGGKAVAWLGLGILGLSLQPVDVSLRSKASGPGFVPVLVGLLTREAWARAGQNEIVALGCTEPYNPPRWVWVWGAKSDEVGAGLPRGLHP